MKGTKLNSNLKKKRKPRHIIEFFDFIMAIINFLLMFLIIILILHRSVIITIIGLIFSIILLVGMIFTFLRRNPFYIYFCYGLLLCGALYALPSVILFPTKTPSENILFIISIILLFPEICYIINLTRGYSSGTSTIARYKYYEKFRAGAMFDVKSLDSQWYGKDLTQKLKEEDEQKRIKEQYNFNRIVLISTGCIIGFFITAIISASL